jgi:hypothetical protein
MDTDGHGLVIFKQEHGFLYIRVNPCYPWQKESIAVVSYSLRTLRPGESFEHYFVQSADKIL